MIEIREATKAQASDIARLIMMAMTDDCCLHFCGVGHGLEDFLKMMTTLVEREDSQYSYRNTLVAMADNKVVGIAVSYNGGKLHELRQPFIWAAKEYIGKDHSGMDDETQAGELYLDSLAVLPDYRRQGIAQCLLHATKEKADKMGLPCVGLLVDKGNPAGETLYASVGFQYRCRCSLTERCLRTSYDEYLSTLCCITLRHSPSDACSGTGNESHLSCKSFHHIACLLSLFSAAKVRRLFHKSVAQRLKLELCFYFGSKILLEKAASFLDSKMSLEMAFSYWDISICKIIKIAFAFDTPSLFIRSSG